ncbi:MAG: DUF2071 domain-containing protein [Chitinophagaceae bacterium]
MFDLLKNHPFAVEAFFKKSLVITIAVPKDEIIRFLPPCLTLDLFDDHWAFLAVAVVQTQSLRPKGLPRFFGNNFILTGYRIFTRFTMPDGRRLRGLYILRSETNLRKMELLGSIFTRYRYQTTDIIFSQEGNALTVHSESSSLHITANELPVADLPEGSPFSSWKEARRFAGPLPFTFSWIPDERKVLVIEGVREDWDPIPVEVDAFHSGVIDQLGCKGMVVASGFLVRDIPYYWKKGKLVPWEQKEK